MRLKRLLIGAILVPAMAAAQGGGNPFIGGEAVAPWTQFKLNPKTRINLNFHNASIDAVIDLLSKNSGITIVKDPALTGAITVTSAKPVSLGDAFQILSTTLSLKGYSMNKQGNLLVIKGGQKGGGGGLPPGFDPSQLGGGGGGRDNNSVLKVFPITYANASQLAKVVNDVFSPNGPQPANPFAAFQNPFRGGPGRQFGQGNGQSAQPTVRASSDDFSNSVIVNAPTNMMDQVAEIIGKLDKRSDDPQTAKVYHLTYATASLIAPTIQNVLTANAPKGRGGIGGQNVDITQRFQQALRFGGNTQAAFGTVVADDRTNSLVVTATPDNHDLITKVIADLDTEVPIQNTTFVFPLSNARATDIASLMQQSFGTRSGLTNNRPNTTTTTGNPRQTIPNRAGAGAAGSTSRPPTLGGGQLNANPNPSDGTMAIALADPNADSGELMTSVGVQQGGGFGGQIFRPGGGGGQFGGQNQQNQIPLGKDAQGRPVNIRDLQNQITVIPDPNTNSLIVVTTPDNIQLVQNILDQLDRTPPQVMIETMIIETNLDKSSQFGFEWKFAGTKSGLTQTGSDGFGLQNANPALQGFKYTIAGKELSAFMQALQTDTKFQVLSTPRIFTSNNSQAQINISQSIPYVLSTTTDAATGVQSFNYAFEDVGIILTVTPHITSNGYVTMDVDQTANDLQGFTSFNAPIVNQRTASTTVSVKDSETIVLGGIIRSNVTSTVKKIPILGDIPILGELFKSTSKENQKTELMVFLTPHVIRNPDDARGLKDQQIKEMSPPAQKTLKNAIPPPIGDGHKSPPPPGL